MAGTTATAWLTALLDDPTTAPSVEVRRPPLQGELPGEAYECICDGRTVVVGSHQYPSVHGGTDRFGTEVQTAWKYWYSVEVIGGSGEDVVWRETETKDGPIAALVKRLTALHTERTRAEVSDLSAEFARTLERRPAGPEIS